MGLLRLLVTGAAVAAAVNYITKKRPDGTSIADDLKARAPEWKEKARPYVDKLKSQFSGMTQDQNANKGPYPEKFNNFSPDPDPTYSS
ncbi:hypothetical protein [Pedobacter sp. SYSU D00535]|uniref:hypothetical protein n=1 Tax=Pedobacter sp. SYSU D00535 TaxID=2810308 RepID=UPI001A96935E|nr:hypothetical protein [Pedobacter sp. SYSU D00535]